MAITNFYVDNNETVYFNERNSVNLSAGSNGRLSVGLADVGELPGQSTWFINKIQFKFHGYFSLEAGSATESACYFQGGIIPRDISGSNYQSDLTDYHTIKGWPLKMCNGMVFCQTLQGMTTSTMGISNMVRFSRSYSPRKALVLNREQNINWNVVVFPGSRDLRGYLEINVQAKRGN